MIQDEKNIIVVDNKGKLKLVHNYNEGSNSVCVILNLLADSLEHGDIINVHGWNSFELTENEVWNGVENIPYFDVMCIHNVYGKVSNKSARFREDEQGEYFRFKL